MFDIGGLELLVIAIVLIVVVGPKDLPKMLRTFGRVSSQMRRTAGEFRRQFDDALREAELDEIREKARELDPRSDIRKAMNPIRAVGDEIRSSLKTATAAPEPTVPSATQGAVPMEPLATPPKPDAATAPASASAGAAAETAPATQGAAPAVNGEARPAATGGGDANAIHLKTGPEAVSETPQRAPAGGIQ